MKPKPILIDDIDTKRFWSKVNIGTQDECWWWTGYRFKAGYGQFSIRRRGYLAHRISYVISTGIDIPHGMLICHKCDNPPCVNPSHFFLGTTSDNIIDAVNKGILMGWSSRDGSGENNPRALITEEIAREIYAAEGNCHEIADRYGVSHHTVWGIKSGNTWTHLFNKRALTPRPRGTSVKLAKLTEQQVREIRELSGTHREIGKMYGVSKTSVRLIKLRRTWAHVTDIDQ